MDFKMVVLSISIVNMVMYKFIQCITLVSFTTIYMMHGTMKTKLINNQQLD